MDSDLEDLFDDVVDDEGYEDEFAGQDEVVPGSHVAEEFDRAEGLGVQDSTRCRELEGQPENRTTLLIQVLQKYYNKIIIILLAEYIEIMTSQMCTCYYEHN